MSHSPQDFTTALIGLGKANAKLWVYIENRPPLPYYQELSELTAMQADEIAFIAKQTGNHWRNIFNVYAKLVHQLNISDPAKTWQMLRDSTLLQAEGNECLLFSPPKLANLDDNKVHVIMGRTYASKITQVEDYHGLSPEFAVHKNKPVIICPYFDYRQLSNIKITYLCQLINNFAIIND